MKIKIAVIISIVLFVSAYAQQRNEQKLALAQSYEQIGEYESAAKIYEQLYESEPTNSVYITSLYRVYTQIKNYAALVNILDARISQKPDDIEMYGMLGSTYYMMGNEEKAFEVWREPFQTENVNPMFYRLMANYALDRRAFEFAIELYEEGKQVSSDKVIYSLDLARLYSMTMQFEKAAQEYCYILSADPTQQNIVEARVFQNISRPGALDVTLNVIEDCAEKNNLSYAYLLAKLYVEKKSFQKAYEIYLDIDERLSSNGRELYNFARQMFTEKEYTLAANIFKAITDRYPDSPIVASAYLGYARSLEASLFEDYEKTLPLWKPYFPMEKFQSDKTQEVLNAFNLVINLYKHSEPAYESILRIAVVKFYLLNDYNDAKSLLETIVNEAPLSQNSAEAYLELGNIALVEGNLVEAEINYSAIMKLRSADEDQKNRAIYKLGKVNFYQGKFEQAKDNLSKILTNLKDNSANDALELLLLLNPEINDSSNLLTYAEAEFLTEQKKFDEAALNYKKLADNQMAFVLHSISAVKYGEMLLALDQYQESISALELVAAEGEKNIYSDKAVYLLGKINQYGIKNYVKAEKYYQQLLADFPKSIYADDARTQILLLQKKPGT